MESEDKKPIFTKRLIMIILAVILLILIIFLLLHKCGGGGGNYKVAQINLTPTRINVKVGEQQQVYANVFPNDAKDSSVYWSIGDPSVATVDQNGVVTGVKDGTTTVVATANDGSGVIGSATVTVGDDLPELEQIQLNKSTYTVYVGKTILVETTPVPATAQLLDIQYSIYDSNIATVDTSGRIKGVKVGTTLLTVTANNGKIQTTATVKVLKANSGGGSKPSTPTTGVDVSSIKFSQTENCYKLKVGNSYTLSPILLPTNATKKNLAWTIVDATSPMDAAKNKAAQAYASVNNSGVVKALKAGKVNVKVTAENGVYTFFEIQVISSGNEGYCSATYPGGNTGGNGKDNNKVDDSKITPGGTVIDSEKLELKDGSGKKHNIIITGALTADTAYGSTVSDGKYLKNAKCNISIGGDLGLIYKAYWTDKSEVQHEFTQYAMASGDEIGNNGVNVTVITYRTITAADGALVEVENEVTSKNVCDEIIVDGKTFNVKVDNEAPSCELKYTPSKLNENGDMVTGGLVLTASDAGGSYLASYSINGQSTETFDGKNNSETRTIQISKTGIYSATVFDGAGNTKTCSVNVANLEAEGTKATETSLNKTIQSIELKVSNSVLFSNKSTEYEVIAHYADGSSSSINGGSNLTCGANVSDITVNTSTIDVNNEIKESKEAIITCTYSDNGITLPAAEAKIRLKSGLGVAVSNTFGSHVGSFYYGTPNVTFTVKDSSISLTSAKVWFEGQFGTTDGESLSSETNTSATLKISNSINGPGRICYSYTTSDSDISGNGCSHYYTYDNQPPVCTSRVEGSRIVFDLRDTGSGLASFADATNLNGLLTYEKTYGWRDLDSNGKLNINLTVKDIIGASGVNGHESKCEIPSFDIKSLKSSENEEAQNGKLYVKTWGNVSERVNSDGSYYLPDTYTFFAAIASDVGTPEFSNSIFKGWKKLASEKVEQKFNWTIIEGADLVSSLGKSDNETNSSFTVRFKKNGKVKVRACHVYYVNACNTAEYTLTQMKVKPTAISISAPLTITAGSETNLHLWFSPSNTTEKGVKYEISDPSVLSINNGIITARNITGTKTVTVTAVSTADSSIKSRTISIKVTGNNAKPTINISDTYASIFKGQKVDFVFYDADSDFKEIYWDIQKGSCNFNSLSHKDSGNGRNSVRTLIVYDKDDYYACAKVIDSTTDANDKEIVVTSSRKIDTSSLPIKGAINCTKTYGSATTLGIGKSSYATITCESNLPLTINHSNVTAGSNVDVSVSTSQYTSGDIYRVLFRFTITGKANGSSNISLNAGAVKTSTSSSHGVNLGMYATSTDGTSTVQCTTSDTIEVEVGKTSSYAVGCSSSPNTAGRRGDITNNCSGIANVKDITLGGGNAHGFGGTGSITGIKEGTCKITVPAGYITDASGNKSAAKTITVKVVRSGSATADITIRKDIKSIIVNGPEGAKVKLTFKNATTGSYEATISSTRTFQRGFAITDPSKNAEITVVVTYNGKELARKNEIIYGSTNLLAPTVSYSCSSAAYDGSTWCRYGLAVNVNGIPSGATRKLCRVSGTGQCDPFIGTYSTITTSGTYTVCAGYVKDGKNSEVGCKKIVAKIDKTAPTCSMEISSDNKYVTVNVSETGSGLAARDGAADGWGKVSDYTYRKKISSGSFSFTVKDNAGNQSTCTLTVASKTQYRMGSCKAFANYTETTTTGSSCTPSGSNGSSYTYSTCGAARYRFASGTVSGSCMDSNEGLLTPIKATIGSSRYFVTEEVARKTCKDLLKKKCPIGSSLAHTNCDTTTVNKEVVKTTYTATKCTNYSYGPWQDKPVGTTGCNSVLCDRDTKTVYYKAN